MRFVAELGINSEGAPKCACPKTMVEMEILNALNSTVEIELTVKDRRSGKDTMRPVWFVVESETNVFASNVRRQNEMVSELAGES